MTRPRPSKSGLETKTDIRLQQYPLHFTSAALMFHKHPVSFAPLIQYSVKTANTEAKVSCCLLAVVMLELLKCGFINQISDTIATEEPEMETMEAGVYVDSV